MISMGHHWKTVRYFNIGQDWTAKLGFGMLNPQRVHPENFSETGVID